MSAIQKVFWNNPANATIVAQLKNYLNSKNYSSASKSFVKNICDFQIATSNTTLINKLLTLANNDIESAQQIIDYLSNEGNCEASQTFATWATTYYQSHPETTAEQFNNWFMGESEGVDISGYDIAYWENPNINFPQQNLPTWLNFDSAYPTVSGADLVSTIGGAVQQAYNDYPSLSRGYCALKVSRGLNYSGITIPQITTTNGNPGTIMGADGKYYFLSAKALNKWMRETFGTNPATTGTPYNANHHYFTGAQGGIKGENFPTLTARMKGIYSMIALDNIQSTWASGHADKIDDSLCTFGCHFYDSNNQLMPIKSIDIWVLN